MCVYAVGEINVVLYVKCVHIQADEDRVAHTGNPLTSNLILPYTHTTYAIIYLR